MPDFTLKDRYGYLKRKLSGVIADKENVETELAKAKIRWADMELQRDNMEIKLQQANMQLVNLNGSKVNLERELVRTKQELGEALN